MSRIKVNCEKIKTLRLEQGVRQKELSSILCVESSTYSKYENGKLDFTVIQLQQIANYFRVGIDDLIINEEMKEEIYDFEKRLCDNRERQFLKRVIEALIREAVRILISQIKIYVMANTGGTVNGARAEFPEGVFPA